MTMSPSWVPVQDVSRSRHKMRVGASNGIVGTGQKFRPESRHLGEWPRWMQWGLERERLCLHNALYINENAGLLLALVYNVHMGSQPSDAHCIQYSRSKRSFFWFCRSTAMLSIISPKMWCITINTSSARGFHPLPSSPPRLINLVTRWQWREQIKRNQNLLDRHSSI